MLKPFILRYNKSKDLFTLCTKKEGNIKIKFNL